MRIGEMLRENSNEFLNLSKNRVSRVEGEKK